MSLVSEVKSWLWVPAVWVVVYSILLLIGIALGPTYYWGVMLVGVPLTIAPITYKNLVGGGCSVRFQICALVKGMAAGMIFFFLTMIADSLLWPNLSLSLGWNPITLNMTGLFYQIWFFSGIIGGVGARVIEVRGYTSDPGITIAGFEDT
ncbi:MAG: hypothetical protein IH631_01190 [Candidatus Thorarchaeota archaeon]|nr:hypothetical protein [Candidatus Thorarchaeota archaeon]TFH07957.1 MAG: hypothetical protein E4H14_07415 [Candidatus Thorarchaeota archaeon]